MRLQKMPNEGHNYKCSTKKPISPELMPLFHSCRTRCPPMLDLFKSRCDPQESP
jgi:hypothetical protein